MTKRSALRTWLRELRAATAYREACDAWTCARADLLEPRPFVASFTYAPPHALDEGDRP